MQFHVTLAAAALTLFLTGAPAMAQSTLKIFDAHLHYNQEPEPTFALDRVLETFRRNGIGGILSNSRPNKGTHQLTDAKTPNLWVVPFIRPYRTRDDVQNWSNDPAINDLIENEYARGFYRGVGEFHIYGDAARRPVVGKTVAFAVAHDFYMLAHCDEPALLILLNQDAKAKIIWAHTGFSVPVARVRELLDQHPALMAELSYRSGITEAGGQLSAEWRELFARHADRFLLGSDTWVPERWAGYDGIISGYRNWLAQLPLDQAQKIASGNAERIFNGKMSN